MKGFLVFAACALSALWIGCKPEDCETGAPWGGAEPVDTPGEIGTGKANTDAMITANTDATSAAFLCRAYRGGGKDDWFLPSNLELKAMKENLHKAGLGGFADVPYWSSTGMRDRYAQGWDFGASGVQGYTQGRTTVLQVRAARIFTD